MLRMLLPLLLLSSAGSAHDHGVFGYWREPGGSVIHVATCGSDVCATLVALSKSAPSTVDGKNPDVALRNRPLCGLRIGDGFQSSGDKAEGGHLYDPKSGKTYKGSMTAKGNELDLRGYVGIKAFGRSETWTRLNEAPSACSK